MSFFRRSDFPALFLFFSYTIFCITKSNLTLAHGLVGIALACVYGLSMYIQFRTQPELRKEIDILKAQTQAALDQNSSHINSEVEKLKSEFSKFQIIKNQDTLINKAKIKF